MEKFLQDTGPSVQTLDIFRDIVIKRGIRTRTKHNPIENPVENIQILDDVKAMMRRPRKMRPAKNEKDRIRLEKRRHARDACVERIIKSGEEHHLRNWMLNPDLLKEVTRRLPQLAPSSFWSPKNKNSLKGYTNQSYSHEGALFDSKDVFHDMKIQEALQITSCDTRPCRILSNILASVANDMRTRLATVTDIAPIAVVALLAAIYGFPDSGEAVTRVAAAQLQFIREHGDMLPILTDTAPGKIMRTDPNPYRVSPRQLRNPLKGGGGLQALNATLKGGGGIPLKGGGGTGSHSRTRTAISQTQAHPGVRRRRRASSRSTKSASTPRGKKKKPPPPSRAGVGGRWTKFRYHPPATSSSTPRRGRASSLFTPSLSRSGGGGGGGGGGGLSSSSEWSLPPVSRPTTTTTTTPNPNANPNPKTPTPTPRTPRLGNNHQQQQQQQQPPNPSTEQSGEAQARPEHAWGNGPEEDREVPMVVPWSVGAVAPMEALCDLTIANLLEHEAYFEQVKFLRVSLERGLRLRQIYKDDLAVVVARRRLHVRQCELAMKRWANSMLRFTFEKWQVYRLNEIRRHHFAGLLNQWNHGGVGGVLCRTMFMAWRRAARKTSAEKRVKEGKERLKQLHEGKMALNKMRAKARRLREKIREIRAEHTEMESKYDAKQRVIEQSAEDITSLDNVLRTFRVSLLSACQTLATVMPKQIQNVLDDPEARMAMTGTLTPTFKRWSALNGIHHQVELEQARRWRPDLQAVNLEVTAVMDRQAKRAVVKPRKESEKDRRATTRTDFGTAQHQYHWRDDFGAPEAYQRVQTWMQHQLSHGAGVRVEAPPLDTTPSPQLWPWMFQLLNALLPATLGVYTQAGEQETEVAVSERYLREVLKQGTRTMPEVGRYLSQLDPSWRAERHMQWRQGTGPAVAKVRTEHIQFALLVELMQQVSGLDHNSDEEQLWDHMSMDLRSRLLSACRLLTMHRRLSVTDRALGAKKQREAGRMLNTLTNLCADLSDVLDKAGEQCAHACTIWSVDGKVWQQVQSHLVRLSWLHLSRSAIWTRPVTLERWAARVERFMASDEMILPNRPLSVGAAAFHDRFRHLAEHRDKWRAEANKFLDPDVRDLFADFRPSPSPHPPPHNPLAEGGVLMSGKAVTNEEIWLQVSTLPTSENVRNEAAALASKAEKASLEAQHHMRQHVQTLFDKLDPENTGTLSLEEVGKYCREHGVSGSRHEQRLMRMLSKYDADHNELLTQDEFFEFYKEHFEEIAMHDLEVARGGGESDSSYESEEEEEEDDGEKKESPFETQTKWKTLKKGLSNDPDGLFNKLKGVNPEVFIAKGNLTLFKCYLERHPETDTFTMCFGNVPAIVVASYYKQLHIVAFLLDHDTDHPEAVTKKEAKLIKEACAAGDVEKVQHYLDSIFHEAVQRCALMNAFLSTDIEGAQQSIMITRDTRKALSVNAHSGRSDRTRRSSMGMHKGASKNLLLVASKTGDVLRIQEALDAGVNVNQLDDDNCTALMHSAHQGSLEVLRTLLQHGANPLHRDIFRRTALAIATEHNYVDAIIALVRYNAGPTLYVKDKLGRIPIQITQQEYTREFLTKFMQDTPRDEAKLVLDYLDNPGQSSSNGSYGSGPPEIMSANLARQTFNRRSIYYLQNKLCSAAAHGDLPFIQKSIRAQAKKEKHRIVAAAGLDSSLSKKEKQALSATHLELKDNETDTRATPVSMTRDEFNLTPLMHAVSCRRLNVCRLLLRTPGADPMAVSSRGNTVLHFAYERGSHDMLELLFHFGFQRARNVLNRNGKKPSDLKNTQQR